ncbi:MAG: hypothetical protein HN712_16150 [Gemmatimonadetes bacterium]|nr:hypothetical protein [Gemmatimonadota bacterium]MBT6149112.1 hypothetical protein [Gemmatimonadota bacterium]MBT7861847.1 hypothetical protein [Gemmatimonadota bacterium]
MRRRAPILLGCLAILLQSVPQAGAQRATGFENPYYTSGTTVAPATLVPSVRKWYLPQRLYTLYDWRQETYSNYARDNYQRYNNVFLEGSPFYDVYGNYITQGWQIYDWTEDYPSNNGSSITKNPRFRSWFNNILISSSHAGQFHSSLMVGDGIRATLTPLTFSKPRFDGVQWDIQTDKYALTLLSSRINNTAEVSDTELGGAVPFGTFTNMYGARGQAQIGDFARLGVTFVNAAHRNTELPFGDNSLSGLLSGPMNTDFVRSVVVRVTDDSPEDGEGGALLSRWRIFINGVEHTDDISPTVEGGVRRRGVIEASGTDAITLTYNIEDFSPSVDDEITDFREIELIEVGLVLANDYRVEVTSNKQTNNLGTPVYLPVLRASGNVQDGSNQAFHKFRYGLPTGNRVVGFDLQITDVGGFELRGEYVRNFQYRRFPNENITKGQALATNKADAFYLTAQQRAYPWTIFAEAFSIDTDYSTSAFIPNSEGEVFYDNENRHLYEFVDDNDDQDELPDWSRLYFGSRVNTRQGTGLLADNAVFPGIDENNDDISDFNRNFNSQPDYTEPFIRFDVDPPEFLFGMDMNSNGVIDRFEDDNEADYPYKRGRRGYNTYAGLEIRPEFNLMFGRLDQRLLRTDRENQSTYMLLTAKHEIPEQEFSISVITHPRKIKDDIPDDVLLWTEQPGTRGLAVFTRDPLAAQDVFVNTSYLEVHYDRYLPFTAKVKHEFYNQLGDEDTGVRDQSFFGVMTKGEYPFDIERFTLLPRWKQLYSSRTPPVVSTLKTQELTEILSLQVIRPVNKNIAFIAGAEYEIFSNLREKPDPLPSGYLLDGNTWILAGQVANRSAYLGYDLTTNVGVRWIRRDFDASPASSELLSFITVFAGLGTD